MTATNITATNTPRVTVIDPRAPEKAKLRVAAYARVSSDSEDQVNSYIAQVDFYSKHIAGKEEWEMVDIYADEGISGLEARNRDEFNRMMVDCREGKIDRVLCKSISRFARNTLDSAAIAGAMAHEHSDLPCIAENIEDNSRNITRFLVIGKQENKPSGDDKTSLCFALHDRAGALYDALRPFRNHNISMTMIESRPLKSGNWEYCFFADILGHMEDPEVAAACSELRQDCAMFKIFGSYPRVIQQQ